eukprot:3396847-Amphidinium_carterae.1
MAFIESSHGEEGWKIDTITTAKVREIQSQDFWRLTLDPEHKEKAVLGSTSLVYKVPQGAMT